ncbi:MAG: YIP1 family protein [Methanosarcinales archaeon]|nr:MAG: YIP1 family protein [Methanosarcinales archaeon]
MNFVEKITGIITNPKETMKSIAQEPLIEEAVMIVGIYAIIAAIAAYVQSYKINIVFENVTPEMQAYLPNESTTMMIAIVSALAGIFIMWIIGTGIIHFISKAFGGEGKFSPNLITAAGFSMIPQIIGIVLNLALYLNMDPVTVTMDMTNPRSGNSMMTPYLYEMSIVNLILMLWAGIIFFYGVQSVHKISPGKSAIAVGIPLVFSIIMMLWTLWNSGIL